MIRFETVAEPAPFAEKAAKPGAAWLASHPDSRRPRDYWTPFRPVLAEGFRNLCAYAAMYVSDGGTVDHFVSWHEDPNQAYAWSNYRFAGEKLNKIKQHLRSSQLLDPFEIGDGWFEILLPSLQLVVTDRIPVHLRDRAASALKRLRLDHHERIIRERQGWYRLFQQGKLSLAGLAEVAPLIAAAVAKAEGR